VLCIESLHLLALENCCYCRLLITLDGCGHLDDLVLVVICQVPMVIMRRLRILVCEGLYAHPRVIFMKTNSWNQEA
jgi:hypothetical protein